jgi:predicted DNA-binding transcriptional regulator AlpA
LVARLVERALVIERSPPDPVVAPPQQVKPAAPYLTERQFCELYQVPARTVVRWRKEGGGPAFVRLGPRHIRYRLADCEAWALARTFSDRTAEQSAQQAA